MTEGEEGCSCKMSFSSPEAFNNLIDCSKPGLPTKNPVQVLTFLLGPFTALTDRLNAILRPTAEDMEDRAFFEKNTVLTLYTVAGAISAFFIIFWQQSVELGIFAGSPTVIPYVVLGLLLARAGTLKESKNEFIENSLR